MDFDSKERLELLGIQIIFGQVNNGISQMNIFLTITLRRTAMRVKISVQIRQTVRAGNKSLQASKQLEGPGTKKRTQNMARLLLALPVGNCLEFEDGSGVISK